MTTSSIKRLMRTERWPAWAQELCHCTLVYVHDVERTDLLKQASAMAYTTLFSLVPSIAAVFTLLGLFLPLLGNHGDLLDSARQFLFKNLATGSGTQVVEYLEKFIAGLNLKTIGVTAFVFLLVTLVSLLKQIEEALNRIWLVSDARPLIMRFIYFWLFLTLGMLGLSILIGLSAKLSFATLLTKKTLAVADSADDIPVIAMTFSWLAGCAVFYLVYKIVPNCFVKNKSAVRGALLAGTLFYILSKFYTLYVSKYANYKSVYGTLAAFPIFLMWIYVCWVIVLAGALFAWRWQQGFPSLRESKTIEAATTNMERMRNHQIRTHLPFLTLLTIYQRFLQGTGQGISTSDLVTQFHLPYVWIHESVEVLRELNLVLLGKPSGILMAGSDNERWFPTQPPENVSTERFAAMLSQPLDQWFESWDSDVPENIKELVFKNGGKNLKGQTIRALLN